MQKLSPSGSSDEQTKRIIGLIAEEVMTKCPPDMVQFVGDEVFLLSCKVIRYNKYGWRNTRFLALTEESILILK